MSEIRFITSSDEHLANLNPGYRCDSYHDAILKKLEWQGKFAKEFKTNAILRGGDLYHLKAANKTTSRTQAIVANIHKKYHCPTFAMAGNHDLSNNDLDSIPGQPLGVMFASHVFSKMEDEIFIDGTLKVRVIGIPYTTDIDVHEIHDRIKKKDETYTIAFIHALASMAPDEKIQSFFNERIFDYRDLVFEGCPDVFVFGHYHKDQGVVDHLGVKFVNLGAISRGALTFENLDRKPKISSIILNSQGISVEEHVVPHEDSTKVFDLVKKKQLDQERKSLDLFISQLRNNASLVSDDIINNRKLELNQYPEDLRNLALATLEAAEAGTLDD